MHRVGELLEFLDLHSSSFASNAAAVHTISSEAPLLEATSTELPLDDSVVLELCGLTGSAGGYCLFSEINLRLVRGKSVAVQGISGCGKSSLLRVVAGLWPSMSGHVCSHKDGCMFLPQKPYCPLGSLAAQVS